MTAIEDAREQAGEALGEYKGSGSTPDWRIQAHSLASALRALLDAIEPPAQTEPAEDEREALVEVIRLFFQNWRAIGKVSAALEVSIDSLEGAVDDLIELTGPRPITDEMEYQVRDVHGEVWAWADTLEEARHYAAQEPEGEPARIEHRRVSHWSPVDEEARR